MKGTILYPTRGGKGSYANQYRVIHLAKERGEGLIFLYISNVQFLGLTASPIVVDVETELDEMGDFLLAMAQERAEKAGVKAKTLVRRGLFREKLKEVIQEYPITSVVLGRSSASTSLITQEYTDELGEEISRETGVQFLVIEDGEIVETYHPPVSRSNPT